MKKEITAMLVLFSVVTTTQANLVINGDFENPDITGNANTTAIPNWTKAKTPIRMDETLTGTAEGPNLLPGNTPGVTNQAVRMGGTAVARMNQALVHNWTTSDSYTLDFNASEIWFRAGAGGDDLTVRIIESASKTELWSTGLLNLDGTHLGDAPEAYNVDWAANQTFSFAFNAADFTTGTEGSAITIEFESHGVVSVDNVVMIPEPAALGLIAMFGGGLLFIRRKLIL